MLPPSARPPPRLQDRAVASSTPSKAKRTGGTVRLCREIMSRSGSMNDHDVRCWNLTIVFDNSPHHQ